MSEIFLDTETTGLSFKDGHRIVEIACIETQDLIPTNRVFHKLINPQRMCLRKHLEFTATPRISSKKETFDQISQSSKFINGKKVIIHNANFDVSF